MLLYKNKEVLGAAVTEPVLVKSLVTISSSMKTTDVNVNIKNPSIGQRLWSRRSLRWTPHTQVEMTVQMPSGNLWSRGCM